MIKIKLDGKKAAENGILKPIDRRNADAGKSESEDSTQALKRKKTGFTGNCGNKDYTAIYRAVFDFHKRHNPPQLDSAYWQTHNPGEDDIPQSDTVYWQQTAQDMSEEGKRFDNDPFIIGLLICVYNELEREYEATRRRPFLPDKG